MLARLLQSYYQRWFLNLLVSKLSYLLPPYIITLLSVIFGSLVIPALYGGNNWIAASLLLISGIFDTLDGAVARYSNNVTELGAALDIIGDRLVECCVLLGLFLVEPISRGLTVILVLCSVLICVTSFVVCSSFSKDVAGNKFDYSRGLIERFEAFIFFIAMILLPQYFTWLANIFSGLMLLTAWLRLMDFRQNVYNQ